MASDAFSSGAIVESRYCMPYPIDLAFARKVAGVKHGSLAVTDVHGKLMFKVKGSSWSWHNKRVLVDAFTNHPLACIQEKFRSAHGRWRVFKGDSDDLKDLLFSVKRSSVLQFHTNLDVFLASNTKEEECDFKIKGEFDRSSTVIYKGNTSVVVAEMSKKHKVVDVRLNKHAFGVMVNPNTDVAFIATLFVILHEKHQQEIATAAAVEASTEAAMASTGAAMASTT